MSIEQVGTDLIEMFGNPIYVGIFLLLYGLVFIIAGRVSYPAYIPFIVPLLFLAGAFIPGLTQLTIIGLGVLVGYAI